MYLYAKGNNLHKGLISSLLQQMLYLTLKLDMCREDLFKEYLERPAEVNTNLRVESVQKKNRKGLHKLMNWNYNCL